MSVICVYVYWPPTNTATVELTTRVYCATRARQVHAAPTSRPENIGRRTPHFSLVQLQYVVGEGVRLFIA